MFDDLQNQPNPQNGAPAQGGFGNNQNQFQNQIPPQAQPSQASGFDQPRYQTMPKEDVNQRIERLSSSGANQSGGKKMYAAIGAIVILLLAGGGAFAGYHYWPEIIAGMNKLTGKQVEQLPSGDNSGINNQNPTNENAANNQALVLNVEWKNCAVDADCAEAQAGCCDCKNGGAQNAISAQFLDEWQNMINDKCQNSSCIALYACKNGKTACVNSICEFQEEKEDISDISKWNKFTSENLGIDFHYPSSWVITENKKTLEIDAGDSRKIKLFENNKEPLPDLKKVGDKTVIIDNREVKGELYLDNTDNIEVYYLKLSILSGSLYYQIMFDKGLYEDLSKIYSNMIPFIELKDDQTITNRMINLDSDNDGLTDVDEVKYGTDANKPDTDGDGYSDGAEVKNGYNPMGAGKLK